jgi:hypothetical protein
MPQLKTFISDTFRPEINGAMLDKQHQTHFVINNQPPQHIKMHALCFGPKKDRVLVNLEHAILNQDKILILYYEDIHTRWSYVKTHQAFYFIYQKNKQETLIIHPECLYIRGCYIQSNTAAWRTLGNFYQFVDIWPGKVFCAPKSQCSNESKPYQLNHPLRAAAKNKPMISIGTSYIIKGSALYQKKITHNKSYIVKSLSGIRSIVVDQTEFMQWEKNNIQNLPVLFQEKAEGQDVRVHVIANKTFSKLSLSKHATDYRYDEGFFKLINMKNIPRDIKQFACSMSAIENNPLMGIDFIKTKSQYVVLEANPSPGWSAYHECNGIQLSAFIKTLLNALKSS